MTLVPISNKQKIAQNSTNSRNNIPFFDQNLSDGASNLGRQFLPFDHQRLPGSSEKGQQDQDRDPRHQGGRDGYGQGGSHGE